MIRLLRRRPDPEPDPERDPRDVEVERVARDALARLRAAKADTAKAEALGGYWRVQGEQNHFTALWRNLMRRLRQ